MREDQRCYVGQGKEDKSLRKGEQLVKEGGRETSNRAEDMAAITILFP